MEWFQQVVISSYREKLKMTKSIGLRDNKASESDKGTQIQVKLIEIVKEQKKN